MQASEQCFEPIVRPKPLYRPQPTRVVCVASGKGGVGKTNVAVNLGIALARQRKHVMLLDADLGLANIDVVLGLQSNGNLSHVISGEKSLEDVLLAGPQGIKIVPASSGIQSMAALSDSQHAGLIGAFSDLNEDLDVLLIDSAAGISDSVIKFSCASQDIIVVVCDEPASFTDAYALIKLLSNEHGMRRFHILANRASSLSAGRELFDKLFKVTSRFLDVIPNFLGVIPEDPYIHKAIKRQQAVVELFPDSRSAAAFRRLATQFYRWSLPPEPRGGLQFFFERLVQAENRHGDWVS